MSSRKSRCRAERPTEINFSGKTTGSSRKFSSLTLSQDVITDAFFAFSANTGIKLITIQFSQASQTMTLQPRSCVRSWLALDTWKLEVLALNEPLRIHVTSCTFKTAEHDSQEFVEGTSSSRNVSNTSIELDKLPG